jgi:phage regulator Rha-like protein
LSGRRPRIKDGVGFQRGSKENTKIKINGHELPKFVKEKGKVQIVHISCANAHVVYSHVKNDHASTSHVHIAHSSSARASSTRHIASHAKFSHVPNVNTKNALNCPFISYHTFDASYVLALKSSKVVAKYVGPRHKNTKSCV